MKLSFGPTGRPWDESSNPPRPLRTFKPWNGPLMLSDPTIRGGRPTNINNVLIGIALTHLRDQLVPRSRDYDLVWTPERDASFEWVTNEQLHDEALRNPHRRRPLTLPLSLATELRELYWQGRLLLKEIQARAGWKTPSSAYHLVHGLTYWYAG